jgi:hypothetical protein
MGRTACTEPQCLYKGALYLYLYLYIYFQIFGAGSAYYVRFTQSEIKTEQVGGFATVNL